VLSRQHYRCWKKDTFLRQQDERVHPEQWRAEPPPSHICLGSKELQPTSNSRLRDPTLASLRALLTGGDIFTLFAVCKIHSSWCTHLRSNCTHPSIPVINVSERSPGLYPSSAYELPYHWAQGRAYTSPFPWSDPRDAV
jgi:hypothetical protein